MPLQRKSPTGKPPGLLAGRPFNVFGLRVFNDRFAIELYP